MKTLNQIISEIDTPAENVFLGNLMVFFDGDGKILNIYNSHNKWIGNFMVAGLIDRLEIKPNIRDSFDFSNKNLDELCSNSVQQSFPVKESIVFYEGADDFVTDLPVCFIRVYKTKSNKYLGVVFPSGAIAPKIHQKNTSIVYVDDTDIIRGYSLGMFNTQKNLNGRANILGQPLYKFLSPTPLQIRKSYFDKYRDIKKGWRKVFSCDSLSEGTILKLTADITFNGSIWNNTSNKLQYIKIDIPVNFQSKNYRLSVDCDITNCEGPILVAGGIPLTNHQIDYQAAASFEKDGHVLKRQGIPIQYSSAPKPNGRTVLALEKIGRGLCYIVNNVPIIEYYDVELNENEESFFSIGLRIGYSIKINRILVESDTLSQITEIEMVSETLKKPRRNYSMLRMGYTNLGKRFPTVEAYLFNDVTSLQARVDTYRLQYEAGLRKSSELEVKLRKLTKKETIFIGSTPEILKIKETAASVADFDVSILIQGPTGTGKEILAKSIHDKSRRSKYPFMKVDCSAMPEALIESELFGHEKGSFTGAHEARAGRFEQANHGTIFIDEIGNLNMHVQAKLLGFLQDHTISRIGGSSIELDVRIIAATNIPMEILIREGKMRSDLFYRLNTVVFNLPPLSKRIDDIPILSARFLLLANEQYGKNILSISRKAMDILLSHGWPGNVRELENVILRAYMFCDRSEITEKDIVLTGEVHHPGNTKKNGTRLKNMSKEKMVELLKKNNNIISGVARELNISRQACYVNMRKLGIDTTRFRLK